MAKLMECLVDDTNSDNVASVTQVKISWSVAASPASAYG